MEPKVSIYRTKNNKTGYELTVADILNYFKTGRWQQEITQIRSVITEGNPSLAEKLKDDLPCVTFSGSFGKNKSASSLMSYSKFIILDLDYLLASDVPIIKQKIISLPYTYSCFVSPRGCGLKILVRVDSTAKYHDKAFNEVKSWYESQLNLKFDISGKNINRLCFVSYDPDLFLNTNSETFKTLIHMVENEIESITLRIEAQRLDITEKYEDWLKLGFSLYDALGEQGRNYFHRLSVFYPKYDSKDCDLQYDKIAKSKGSGVTYKSFFWLAKQNGIDISVPEEMVANESTNDKKATDKEKMILIDFVENYLSNKYKFRYNVVLNKIEFSYPDSSVWEPIVDYKENSIYRDLQKKDIKCSLTMLRNLLNSDYCPQYNPFLDYFNHLPEWDGQLDIISELAETVQTTNQEFFKTYFKKWLVASVACAIENSIVNHQVLIFTGNQGIGKTTWMLNLCPPALKQYIFSGTIDPSEKDTLIHMAECMFVNIDELENLNRTEIGSFKQIITLDSIRMRRPYGHCQENLPRRSSFMGSVNSGQFLIDPTGSRRFLCFEVTEIDYKHNINIDLVYAQALYLYKTGFKFYFDGLEIKEIIQYNEQFQFHSVEEELLLKYFKVPESGSFPNSMTASEILNKIANKANINVNNGSVVNLGKVLKKNGFNRVKKNGFSKWEVEEITEE